MKSLELDGKRYELVEIKEEPKLEPRKTGYERAGLNKIFFLQSSDGRSFRATEHWHAHDERAFESANYYTDEQLARDNVRADALMRNLRRFSAEGRKQKIDWGNSGQNKFYINCNYHDNAELYIDSALSLRRVGAVYFDTKKLAEAAIEKYRDELTWYFTEYQDTAEFREEV